MHLLHTYMQTNEDIRIAVAKLKDLSANAAQARSIMSYFTGLSASAMENVRKEHAQLQALMNQAEETEKVLNEPVDMIAEMTKPVSMEVMEEMLLPLLQNPSISAQSTHSAPSNPPSISNTQRPPHPPPAAPPPAAALVVQPVSRRQATSGKVFHSVVPG